MVRRRRIHPHRRHCIRPISGDGQPGPPRPQRYRREPPPNDLGRPRHRRGIHSPPIPTCKPVGRHMDRACFAGPRLHHDPAARPAIPISGESPRTFDCVTSPRRTQPSLRGTVRSYTYACVPPPWFRRHRVLRLPVALPKSPSSRPANVTQVAESGNPGLTRFSPFRRPQRRGIPTICSKVQRAVGASTSETRRLWVSGTHTHLSVSAERPEKGGWSMTTTAGTAETTTGAEVAPLHILWIPAAWAATATRSRSPPPPSRASRTSCWAPSPACPRSICTTRCSPTRTATSS